MCGFVVTVVVGGRSSQEVDFFFKYYARGAAVGEEFLLSSADKQVCWQLFTPRRIHRQSCEGTDGRKKLTGEARGLIRQPAPGWMVKEGKGKNEFVLCPTSE